MMNLAAKRVAAVGKKKMTCMRKLELDTHCM